MILWALWACKGPCGAGGTPTLVVGLGEEAYQAVADGGDAPLIFGPQGGQHLDLAIEATNLEMQFTSAAEIVGRIDGEVVATGTPWFEFQCDDDVLHASGLRLLMEVEPEEVIGQTMQISMAVTDSRRTEVMAERTLSVVESGD